jgi:ribose 1,5-bisphosphokinase
MSGVFVAVVGPSGVGKDTLINFARAQLAGEPRFEFVRRVITRAADAASEDHDSLSIEDFAAAEAAGAFALAWDAHGLRYGLPVAVDAAIAAGKVVVANMSRQMLGALQDRYENCIVVEVWARPEVIAQRLAARGRESAEAIAARLARPQPGIEGAVRIENSAARETAGEALVALLLNAALRS